jgi:hypothetical protein
VYIPDTVWEIGENAFSSCSLNDDDTLSCDWLPNLSDATKKKLTDLGYPGPTKK